MWVGVHCWTAVPADEHVSCSQSALAVGQGCEGTRLAQTMHLPQSSSVLQVEGSTCTCTHTRARTHTQVHEADIRIRQRASGHMGRGVGQ